MRTILHVLAHGTEKRLANQVAIAGVLALPAISSGFAAEHQVPAKYAAIQAAVDAASDGDTIRIAPGVYTNQVTIIRKRLTMIGQPGAVLRATGDLPLAQGPAETHFPILYIRSSEVTLRGLMFEGERLAGSYLGDGELRGALLRNSSAIVENCAFFGFRERTLGAEEATAFTATGTSEEPVHLRVTDCTFADNYAAMRFIGSGDRRSLNITLENNTIIGPGPLDRASPTAGIIIREGVGGRIAGNTIGGYSYTGTAAEFDISFGIEASHQANYPALGVVEQLEIEGNTLRDNQIHISLTKADESVIKNNRFQGSAPGIIPTGLAVSGKRVKIADNQFEDLVWTPGTSEISFSCARLTP
ncbi:MAG: right-handed parallel beta-helix repeat-containing protein [Verrucomicrobiota bacterium]